MLAVLLLPRRRAVVGAAPPGRIDMRCASLSWALVHASVAGLLLSARPGYGQELEPRVYSPSPVGTNFLLAAYTNLTGDVLTDPALPITDVHARLQFFSLGFARTFGLAGNTASLGFVMPFVRGDLSGNVIDAPRDIYRAGVGDVRLRFAYSMIGNPALSPEDFARRTPSTSVGASLTVSAPTGQYVPSRLVNVGTNRWGFRPEIGVSQPLGNWFFDASTSAWLFTNNDNFLGSNVRSQSPLWTIQLHGGYGFRPGLWIAADVGYSAGGYTRLNGIPNDDRQSNMRYGLTLSVPIARGWSTKLAVSNGLVTRAGGDYKVISVTLQYRWFDH